MAAAEWQSQVEAAAQQIIDHAMDLTMAAMAGKLAKASKESQKIAALNIGVSQAISAAEGAAG